MAGTKLKLLRLPIYAPWTNPTEKVWRKLSQALLLLHSFRDVWLDLQQAGQAKLARLLVPSSDQLPYVGLYTDYFVNLH